jgi:hypothetical protein
MRKSAEIEEAENGYVVRVTGEGPKGEHDCKRFVAKTEEEAKQLAGDGLNGKIKIGKKKGSRGNGAVSQAPSSPSPRKRAKKKSSRKRG